MKKFICFILTILIFLTGFTVTNGEAQDQTTVFGYFNDVKMDVSVLHNENVFYENYYLECYIPLESVLDTIGVAYTIEEKDGKMIITLPIIKTKLEINDEYILRIQYADSNFQNSKNSIPYLHYIKDSEIYITFEDMADLIGGYAVQKANDVYLYSYDYYNQHVALNSHVGHQVEMDVYVNGQQIDTPVRRNNGSPPIQGPDNLSDFVWLRPVFEALGAVVEWQEPDQIYIRSERVGYYKIQVGGKITAYNDASFSEDTIILTLDREETYLIGDRTYIPFSLIRYMIHGSLDQDDYSKMSLYSNDFERTDIPATLQECYLQLNEQLDQETKDDIKNSSVEDLIGKYYFSLGLWIRNNWIYPSHDRIAKVFAERDITQPDTISSMIIIGYNLYLNEKPAEIDDILTVK